MKYQAFNNRVCKYCNTVLICKRVYFLTVGHQREMIRWIIFDSPPAAGAVPQRDCWWEATLKLSLTPDFQLKDAGITEDSISIGTVKESASKANCFKG